MKERPILFSGPMVRALLAGTKTQTRRALRLKPQHQIEERDDGTPWPWVYDADRDADFWLPCPHGQPGDRLWVREAFMHEPADYCWEASVSIPSRPAQTVYRADFPNSQPGEGWKPSIHMSRSLCRLELEITGVRVERLQDISEADAIAEGIERGDGFPGWYRGPLPGDAEELQQAGRDFKIPTAFARLAYQALWESINGHGSWGGDPWVWVIEFRRLP